MIFCNGDKVIIQNCDGLNGTAGVIRGIGLVNGDMVQLWIVELVSPPTWVQWDCVVFPTECLKTENRR